jgi:hypothetical protein
MLLGRSQMYRPSSRSGPSSTGTSLRENGTGRVVLYSQSRYYFSLFLSSTAQQSFVQIILAQADRDAAVLELLKS